jgi:Uma2 family endonuclease
MSTVMTDLLPRHRVSVDEYYRMDEVGLLAPDVRTELIEGEIIEMPPIAISHAGTVGLLTHLLSAALGQSAQIRVQQPARLDNYSEPQPDLTVVRPRDDFYRTHHHPGPADTLLIVEVSQSSLRLDRDVKVPLYARHQVPEIWLIDLDHDRIHFFRMPRDRAYTEISFTDRPKVVELAALPGVTVDLSSLFAS